MSEQKPRITFAELLKAKPEKDQIKDQPIKIEDHQKDPLVDSNRQPPDSHQLDSQISTMVDIQTATKADIHQPPKVDSHQLTKKEDRRKGDRHSKQREMITVRLQPDLLEEIRGFCHKNKLLLQDFIELAACHYMETVDIHQVDSRLSTKAASKTSTMVDSQTAHDDLKIFKTHDDIIMLYQKMTNRKWSAADDRAGRKLNDTDRRLIELGMIQTFLQAGGRKINSFAYFVPEILTMVEANFDRGYIDSYLRRRREQLKKALPD